MIRAAAKSGNLTHIAVVPSQDGKLFRALFAPAKQFGVRYAEDADPVTAILLAMKQDVKPVRKAALAAANPLVIPQETVDADPLAELL
jgi:hypothetical protein